MAAGSGSRVVSHSQFEVDYNRFRKANALAGEWTHQLDEFQTITPSLQVGDLRYTGFNAVRDAQFTASGFKADWEYGAYQHQGTTDSQGFWRIVSASRKKRSAR